MLDELKSLLQHGERYIVVENGKPEYVLMRFEDYLMFTAGSRRDRLAQGSTRVQDWERANAELAEVRAASEGIKTGGNVVSDAAMNPDPSMIRLEDLPL